MINKVAVNENLACLEFERVEIKVDITGKDWEISDEVIFPMYSELGKIIAIDYNSNGKAIATVEYLVLKKAYKNKSSEELLT